MEHEEAIRIEAAERYVAHELSDVERDAFEEHFFECPECAEEVRWEQIFEANARAALRAQAPVELQASSAPSQPGWLERLRAAWAWRPALPVSLAANFALAAGLVCVLLIPGRQPAPAQFALESPREYFAPGSVRGDGDINVLPAGTALYPVRFPSLKTPSYSYEIVASSGKRELSGSLPAPAGPNDTLHLTVPVGNLPAGVHTLTVRGLPAGEIASRSRFQVSR